MVLCPFLFLPPPFFFSGQTVFRKSIILFFFSLPLFFFRETFSAEYLFLFGIPFLYVTPPFQRVTPISPRLSLSILYNGEGKTRRNWRDALEARRDVKKGYPPAPPCDDHSMLSAVQHEMLSSVQHERLSSVQHEMLSSVQHEMPSSVQHE